MVRKAGRKSGNCTPRRCRIFDPSRPSRRSPFRRRLYRFDRLAGKRQRCCVFRLCRGIVNRAQLEVHRREVKAGRLRPEYFRRV